MNTEQDILSQLAQSARRLRVARILPDGKLPWEWIRRVHDDFVRFVEEHGLSLSEISRRMGAGFSLSVISQFYGLEAPDQYIGDVDRIARGLNGWMETYLQSLEVPRPAGWVDTAIARRMITVIKNAVEMRSVGLIYSDAGRGKTMTLKAASQIYPQGILVRVRRSTRTPTGLARQLAKALRIKARTTQDIEDRLIDTLAGSDRPIMIDEAHQLTMPALEFLRDLHDECEIPIILAGTHQIHEHCNDSTQFFGQFASRTALRYDITEPLRDGGDTRPLHSIAEIRKIWQNDKVRLADDGAALLCKLANLLGFGGLRLCQQVIMVAAKLAEGSVIDAKVVLRVVRRLHGDNVSKSVMQAVDHSAVQVA